LQKHRYFVLNKPYKMVSQFVSSHKVNLLSDLDYSFPEGTHAVGRLDNNSEGLLILTTNKKITQWLFEGSTPHKRSYLVQVEKEMRVETLEKLKKGVQIKLPNKSSYTTQACEARIINKPEGLPPRAHEYAAHLPQTWLILELYEGKFHQVRKMLSAVGHDCKRLIRISIENLELENLQPGEVKEMNKEDFYQKLNLESENNCP